MPIHWRKFYYNKLVDLKKKEKEEYSKMQSKQKSAGSKVRLRR
jgi:hypothetical protein